VTPFMSDIARMRAREGGKSNQLKIEPVEIGRAFVEPHHARTRVRAEGVSLRIARAPVHTRASFETDRPRARVRGAITAGIARARACA